MKLKLFNILTIGCMAASLSSIASCANPVDPIMCTVTIDLNGGTLEGETGIITRTVESGTTYKDLGEPTKTNASFLHWEKDGKVVLKTDKIIESVSIKAIWDETPVAPTITQKTAKFFQPYRSGGTVYLQYVDSGRSQDVYLINDGQVPYVKIDDFFDFSLWDEYYDLTRTGNVFVVKNLLTSKDGNDVTCTFDIDNQTITFSDYDKFIWYYDEYTDNPLASGCGGGENYEFARPEVYTSGGTYTIDTNYYNIPLYCDDNGAYIPYDFCKNIFDYDLTQYAGIISGSFMFVRNNFYEILDQFNGDNDSSYAYFLYNESPNSARALEGIPTNEPIFDTSYREYCYNLLALTLDTRFGMTVRPSRSNSGQIIEYFPNGAYESLAQYRNDFISNDLNKSNTAMINIMKNYCDDGGHAGYYGCDVTAKDQWDPWDETAGSFGPESTHTNDVFDWMGAARTAALHDIPDGYDSNIEILSSDGDDSNDIAWVTFDEFMDATPSYSIITDETYMLWGTVGMTMYLQKLVNTSGSKIRYVVIDLSNNGGGAVYTEHFLASYLCGRDNVCEPQQSGYEHGGVTHTIWNPHSKAFSKYTYYADINKDGLYNQNDYLPANVQLYCIVSDASFSCGNMLPCHLQACSNCKFIGSRSGGGACYVDSDMHIGLGNVFRSSSNFHALKYGSTVDNPITADEGVIATYDPLICDEAHASDFFDRDAIISWILSH